MTRAALRQAVPGALALALFVVVMHACLQLARQGYPYEAWDEIATANNAVVLEAPARYRVYAYGSLDTFFHVVAQQLFDRYTDTGSTTERHAYSNTVPPSLDNPHLLHGEKTWGGTDYGYFRGLNYRDAIFIARDLYLGAILALGCLLGALAIRRFGAAAPPLLCALLLLVVTPQFVEQAWQAVPGAINGLLATAMFLCALAAVLQERPRLFVLPAVLFPLALNMKIDVAPMGIVLAAGFVAASWLARASLRASAVLCVKLIALALAVFVASRPGVLFHPWDEWRIQATTLATLSSGEVRTGHNVDIFRAFLDERLFTAMGRPLPASWGLAIVAGALFLYLLVIALQRDFPLRKKLLAGALPVLALAVLWTLPILNSNKLLPRYFLNGAGVFFATLGFAVMLALRQPHATLRAAGTLLLAAMLGLAALRSFEIRADGEKLAQALAANEGLDPAYSRNRASLEIVRLVRAGKYPAEVLVDQHGYTELGVFARNGIKPVYLNVYNYDRILGEVSRPTLVLYVPATGYRPDDWRWARNTRWNPKPVDWTGYEAALAGLPAVLRIPGQQMDSMAIAPVNPADAVVVAEATGRPAASPPRR